MRWNVSSLHYRNGHQIKLWGWAEIYKQEIVKINGTIIYIFETWGRVKPSQGQIASVARLSLGMSGQDFSFFSQDVKYM